MSTQRSFKGVNWGNVTLEENTFTLDNKQKKVFSIPYKSFTNSSVNKTDIIIELNTDGIQEEYIFANN